MATKTVGQIIDEIDADPVSRQGVRDAVIRVNRRLAHLRKPPAGPMCVCGHPDDWHDHMSMTAYQGHCDMCGCTEFKRRKD